MTIGDSVGDGFSCLYHCAECFECGWMGAGCGGTEAEERTVEHLILESWGCERVTCFEGRARSRSRRKKRKEEDRRDTQMRRNVWTTRFKRRKDVHKKTKGPVVSEMKVTESTAMGTVRMKGTKNWRTKCDEKRRRRSCEGSTKGRKEL